MGKSQLQECEAAGDAAATVREQRVTDAGAAHFLLFVQYGDPARWMVPPTFRVSLPSSVQSFWKHSYRHTWRLIEGCFHGDCKFSQIDKINPHSLCGHS